MGYWFNRLFGDLQSAGGTSGANLHPSRPTWVAILTEDEDVIRNHILDHYRAYYSNHNSRFQRMRLNYCLYTDLTAFPSDVRVIAESGTNPALVGETPKITSNQVQRLVNEHVSNILLQKTDIAVVPFGTDWQNTIQADIVKDLLDCIDENLDRGQNEEELHLRKCICGEAFRYIFYNRNKGPLDPTYEKRTRAGKPIMIEGEDGELREFRRAIYQGDVDEEYPFPWDVGLDPKPRASEVQWCFIRRYVPVDELKADYPDLEDEILPTNWASEFSIDAMSTEPLRDHSLVIEFYARSSPYLPQGAYYKITPNVVLESGPNPIPHYLAGDFGNLPIERICDLNIASYLPGLSRLQYISQLQNQYENTVTLRGRNIFLSAHPKWMIPKGACNINRLANKVTVVQYAGGVAPQLVSYNSVPPDVERYQEMVKTDMNEVYGSNPIMRGEPPAGVVANAALQFLDARAQESMSRPQAKADQFKINTYAKRLVVIAENYDNDDQRTYRAIGEDQSWKVKYFDVKALRGPYEVRLGVSSDLPKRKDALMQTVFQMSQIWPGLYPAEAVAEMFRLGHARKFISAGAASWQSAERENYMASKGDTVPDPAEYEDLIVHWKCHWKQMSQPIFRDWPEKLQKELFEHMLSTEYLMLQKAKTNTIFAAKLQELIVWPCVLPLPPDMGPQGPSPGMPAAALEKSETGQMEGATSGAPQKVPSASLNQQRFMNGQFGQANQAIQ